MGWPKVLVLVRHAESVGNLKSPDDRAAFECATHAYPLTEEGRTQALPTGKYLRARFGTFDAYYVSYYERSRETMRIMYPEAHMYEDPRLAEAQRGIYHAMTREEIKQKYPEELIRKDREGLYHYRPFGGENWPDVILRIHSFLGTLSRDYEGQKVLMVVHGHWLLLFQSLIHHFPTDELVKKYKDGVFENASITVYRGETIGSRSHLVLEMENFVPTEK